MYYGNPQRLEHDFIVAPGADPAAIQLAISGVEQATVNAEGDLVLQVPGGEVVQQAPRIYQFIDGRQQVVAGRYVLRDAAPGVSQTVSVAAAEPTPSLLLIGFEVAQYDRKQPLVIDPVLVYSTYLGGSNSDEGSGIAVDGSGNAYVAGYTDSADFPAVNAKYPALWGLRDAFVFKLSGDGQTVRYSTYLGGSGGDYGFGIAVDGSGNAYVTGYTDSADFPAVNAKYPPTLYGDAFIFKLSGDGQTVRYSTCLGGRIGYETGTGIAVDGSGNAYVTGWTVSPDFPAVNAKYPNLRGILDAFIAKISDEGGGSPTDTDGDGLSDSWEIQWFGGLQQNPNNDFDSDSLSNLQEFQNNTDPTNPDTDGDGSSDGAEVAAGTDPLDKDSFVPKFDLAATAIKIEDSKGFLEQGGSATVEIKIKNNSSDSF